VDWLVSQHYAVCNFDKAKPNRRGHDGYWYRGNLLKAGDIDSALRRFRPAVVVHLAARTDTTSDRLEDYIDNTEGTGNLLRRLEQVDFVERAIIASTQYVYKCGEVPLPRTDTDYRPHTAYGRSKVITEMSTREARLRCCWTIVRPVNIWGPWHLRYPDELWKMIDRGWYVHPGRGAVVRTYGYVKNVAYQVGKIMQADRAQVDRQTYYLGENPVDSYVWLNAISRALTGRDVRRIPTSLFVIPALAGDILVKCGIRAPLHSARLKNMIEHYPAPTHRTVEAFGLSHPSLEDNVRETVEWIRSEGRELFQYWRAKEPFNGGAPGSGSSPSVLPPAS
jgi:nucleoside-diphosphate-sugar epimerase